MAHSHIPVDGNTRVDFVPAIADISAPTVAELTAAGAAALSEHLTPDGFNLTWDEATKNTSVFSSKQNYEEPGRTKPTIALKYFKESVAGDDVAATTLTRGVVGFIVVRRGFPADQAFAAADKVDVFSVTMGEQKDVTPAENTDWQIEQTAYSSGDYKKAVAVAA